MNNLRILTLSIFLLAAGLIVAQSSSKSVLSPQQYQELLEAHFDKEGPGASVLVAKKGNIVYRGGIGKANLELDIPMNENHVHRIGSITKQFTAVAILMLLEQGKLDLQDKIEKHIPNYPTQGKTITVEHLLTHTSGIRSMTGMPDFFNNARKDMTTAEMMDYFKNEPMDFAPGEEYRYNNSGYYLLGVIIENISGMTYADFIQRNIFDKVGMDHSHYGSFQEIVPNRAAGYQKQSGTYVNAPYLSMTLPFAAGSLLSNVLDLYKWNRALLSNQLLKQETLQKAYTPYVLNNGKPIDYGYGWGVGSLFGSPAIQHGGGIHGFLTQGIFLPEEDVFVAVFSNCNCQPPNDVAQKIAAIEIGKYTPKETIALSADALKKYEGIYQVNDDKSKRTLRVQDGVLTTQRTGGEVFELFPFEKDKFYFKKSLTIFEFTRDEKGNIDGMKAIRANGQDDIAALTDEKPVVRKEITLDEKVLSRYTGKYKMMPGFDIAITLEDGALMAEPTGQDKVAIYAESETKFFLKVVDVQLEFIKGEDGHFSKMKLNQGGQELEGMKQ